MCAVPKRMHFWPDCYKHTLLAAKVGEMQSELCHEKRAFFDIHTNSRYLYTYKQQIPWSEVWSGNLFFPGQAHSIQHIYIYNTEYRKEPFHEENSLRGLSTVNTKISLWRVPAQSDQGMNCSLFARTLLNTVLISSRKHRMLRWRLRGLVCWTGLGSVCFRSSQSSWSGHLNVVGLFSCHQSKLISVLSCLILFLYQVWLTKITATINSSVLIVRWIISLSLWRTNYKVCVCNTCHVSL